MTAPAATERRRTPVVVRLWNGFLWLAVVGLIPWVVVRAIGFDHRTPFAQLVSFTPYVAAGALAVLLAALVTRRWRVSVAAALLVVAFAAFVLPRVVFSDEPPDGVRLRVMAFNTKIGVGSVEEVLALVRRERPDVLTVQELTPGWAARFEAAGASALLPHSALRALPGAAGTGIWARYPLTDARTVDPKSGFDQTVALLRRPGKPTVEVVSAHPRPPVFRPRDWGSPARWVGDITRLPAAADSGPVRVLAGDFNASLDHSPMRELMDTGYVDAAAAVRKGLVPTWPMNGNKAPPVTIDHVLVDERGGASAFDVYTIAGSDHRAIVADVVLPA